MPPAFDLQSHSTHSDGALPAAEVVARAAAAGVVVVRLEVDDALPGGLAIYGARFGRYPVDPTVAFVLRERSATPASR
jgi:hypothetical protein